MPVATASREAYGRMSSVKPKDHPVYKFLKTFGTGTDGYSNRQIAAIMGRPINTITPRIFELRAAGVVVLAGKRKDLYSGVTVSHWRIATEQEEAENRGLVELREALDAEPRTWLHLADIPERVIVKERNGWLWQRQPHGQFSMSSSNGEAWSPPDELRADEPFYGPVLEVK